MGLDITVSRVKKVFCPHCGVRLKDRVEDCESSWGHEWYEWLEAIGYYVPDEKRTEENDWYGKDMVLTDEQIKSLVNFVFQNKPYNGASIAALATVARIVNDDVVINADW